MTETEQSQEPTDPFAGFSPTMWMAYIYQELGEEGLRELLEQFTDPTPEFIDAVLMDQFGTTIEHDRRQTRESLFPAIVETFPAIAHELQDMGLLDAANIILEYVPEPTIAPTFEMKEAAN
jgi:hypothetical protein